MTDASLEADPAVARADAALRHAARAVQIIEGLREVAAKHGVAALRSRLLTELSAFQTSLRRARELLDAAKADAREGARTNVVLACIDVESAVREVSELEKTFAPRRSWLAITSEQVAAMSVIVTLVFGTLTTCSVIRKADSDAKVAEATALGKIVGPLSFSLAEMDGEPGAFMVTATLTMTSFGADRMFVRKIEFEPFVGRIDNSGDGSLDVTTVIPPNASLADKKNNGWLTWSTLGANTFPDPVGCWIVEEPNSHLSPDAGDGGCNVNGVGVYDVGETLVSSRQWRVVAKEPKFFGVIARVTWDRGKGVVTTPWEYVSTVRLAPRGSVDAGAPPAPTCCISCGNCEQARDAGSQ